MWRGCLTAARHSRHQSSRQALREAVRQVSAVAHGVEPRGLLLHDAAPGSRRGAATQLGTYLESAGAVWGDAVDVHQVQSTAGKDSSSFSWSIDLSPQQLAALRKGELMESPPFSLGPHSPGQARIQFFPKGDEHCSSDDFCSLWLWSDESIGPMTLRIGDTERSSGSSEFCRLQDVLRDGKVEVSIDVKAEGSKAPTPVPSAQQSLHVTGMQLAEWRLFQMQKLRENAEFMTSMPFRFHHVLLGDMYLEVLFGKPHPGFCTLFFRCRVPTMQLQVKVEAGSNFSRSFIALGTPGYGCEDDMKNKRCLEVNLDAPGVLSKDGDLIVRCTLEEVVSLPATLRDMIPRLDERAQWPKRL